MNHSLSSLAQWLFIALAFCLSACSGSGGFQTSSIDLNTPTASNPFDAEKKSKTQSLPLLQPTQQKEFEKDILPQESLDQQTDVTIGSPDADSSVIDVSDEDAEDIEIPKEEQKASSIESTAATPSETTEADETLSMCQESGNSGFDSAHKKEFVCAILPGAIRMNKQVYKQRLQVLALEQKSKNQNLLPEEEAWLTEIKDRYQLEDSASYADLLARVDVVPLPLLITQGAIESGWGSSRAATEGKNLFGIHGSLSKDSCLVAKRKSSICIKKYNSMTEGISDYIQFLNTMKSMDAFRQKRTAMRRANQELDPFALAKTLILYSERGQAYVNQVCKMMRGQNFVQFVLKND